MEERLFNFNEEEAILYVTLPQGKTMAELTNICREEIDSLIMEKRFFGRDVRINGRLTTSMAIVLGHDLSHVCRSVSIFDPKENSYVSCIKH